MPLPLTYTYQRSVKLSYGKRVRKMLCKSSKWKCIEFRENTTYDWCEKSSNSRINNKPKNYAIWQNKYRLWQHLQGKSYLPDTYVIINGIYIQNPINCKEKQLYFLKNSTKDAARDTHAIFDLNIAKKTSSETPDVAYIVQKSIDPLLWKDKKFDIRMIVQAISIDGIHYTLRLGRYGIVRLAYHKYDPQSLDEYTQLTNIGVNRNKDFKCNDIAVDFDESFELYPFLFPKILKIVKDVFESTISYIVSPKDGKTCWITGWDFIFDKSRKAYLIEINHNPSTRDTPVYNKIYDEIATHTLTPLAENTDIILSPLFIDI